MVSKRLTASVVALVSLWGCNSLLGIDGADRLDEGGAGSAGSGAGGGAGSGGVGGRSGGGSGVGGSGVGGSGGEAPAAPCVAGEEPGAGVFVDPRVGDDANEGSMLRPFQTLTQAANAAVAGGVDKVYLAPGSYQEALALRVGDEPTDGAVTAPEGTALSFEGGWKLDGARWERDCAPDAREKTVIASPSFTGVSIRGAFGPLGFRNLSIATATAAPAAVEGKPGESCYGVNAAGEGLRLRFDNVEIDACPGGKGGDAPPAQTPPPAPATCTKTGDECADGAPGANATSPGLPARPGAFGVEGFGVGIGDPGKQGSSGANGARGPGEFGPVSCTFNDTDCCGTTTQVPHGRCGCGGPPGPGGPGGPGGGASVALFVSGEGASADLTFTTLRARQGGDGGLGGVGGPGGEGAPGAGYEGFFECCPANACNTTNCITSPPSPCPGLPAQAPGGKGGPGGAGTRGGGGSGGPSFGFVGVGNVTLTRSDSAVSFGPPGQGAQGAPSGEAAAETTVILPPP
jgi:hypothetical protein